MWRPRAERLQAFLSLYRPIAEGLVKDFYVGGLWELLPASWRPHLERLTLEDLAQLLESPASFRPPEGSMALLARLRLVSAVRRCKAGASAAAP